MGYVPYRFTKEYRVGALELSSVSTLHLLNKHVCVYVHCLASTTLHVCRGLWLCMLENSRVVFREQWHVILDDKQFLEPSILVLLWLTTTIIILWYLALCC